MKKLIFILIMLISTIASADQWVEGSIIGVQKYGPTSEEPVIFLNTYTTVGLSTYTKNQWVTVDISDRIPTDAIEITLDGILVISHGTTIETCDLNIWFRTTDDIGNDSYIAQAIAVGVGNGERQTDTVRVPIINGKFRFKWNIATPGFWPQNCAYAINYSLVGYVR